MSKFKGKKTNNAKINAKIELREFILNSIIDEPVSVLDVFCGDGDMYDAVWNKCNKYLGIDKKKQFDKRILLCGDAEKAISLIKCDDFNVFDIDAYGSPYVILDKITKNITYKKNKIAFILTDGVDIDMRMGNVCKGIRSILNLKQKKILNAHLIHDVFIKKIIQVVSTRLNGVCENIKIARGATGANMRYCCFIINRNTD